MNNLFFNLSHPLLHNLNEGKTIKLGFKILFWLIGAASLLFALYSVYHFFDVKMYKSISFDENMRPKEGINSWAFVFLIATVFAHWIIFQICWFRASTINQTADSRFVVSAIFSIFIRAVGEIVSTYLVVIGFVTGLIALFSDVRNSMLLMDADLGVASIVVGPIIGFLIIAIFYFIAERISALTEIAVNTKK